MQCAARDAAQHPPHALLKGRALRVQRHAEITALAGKIILQFARGLLEPALAGLQWRVQFAGVVGLGIEPGARQSL